MDYTDVDAHPQLIPGSIWERPTKNGSTHSVVIAVSNQGLKPAILEKQPPQVIFLSASGAVLTMGFEQFLSNRTFVDVDQRVAQLVDAIVNPEDDAGDDQEIDIDSTPLPEEIAAGGTAPIDETDVDSSEEDTIPVFEPPVFDGLQLDSHFVSYAEVLGPSGEVIRVLRFLLDAELNIDQIKGAFNAQETQVPTLESFIVDSEAERVELAINNYIVTLLEIDGSGNAVAAVYVLAHTASSASTESIGDNTPVINVPTTQIPAQDVAVTHVIPQLQVVTPQTPVVTVAVK